MLPVVQGVVYIVICINMRLLMNIKIRCGYAMSRLVYRASRVTLCRLVRVMIGS